METWTNEDEAKFQELKAKKETMDKRLNATAFAQALRALADEVEKNSDAVGALEVELLREGHNHRAHAKKLSLIVPIPLSKPTLHVVATEDEDE